MTELPNDYDVIIVGTGLSESILSAALSRIGKSVLHIDRDTLYGGEFCSHSLTSLLEWNEKTVEIKKVSDPTENNNNEFECNNDLKNYFENRRYEWNNKTCSPELKENLLKQSRRFSIDLCPNIFYSRGSFIELLISSDVSKYTEFRLVTQILTQNQCGSLEKVPTSRSDVFKTDQLSMIEKRHMMKFIQSCMKDNDFNDLIGDSESSSDLSFHQFVMNKKFSDKINNYILNAVGMIPNKSQSVLNGLGEVKKFIGSVGRFGDSPFLYSVYGTGELPQCFCRMSAVFGGIFHLNMTIESFHVNKEKNLVDMIKTKSEFEGSKDFNCKHLIMDSSYIPLSYLNNDLKFNQISRCILLTDKTIFAHEKATSEENISLLFFPKTSENSSNIFCIEASSASQCCPKGYYLVYLFCVQSKLNLPEEDFKEFINLFFEKEGSNKIDEPSNISDVQESEKTTKFTENDAPQEEVDINDVKASTTSLNDNGKPRILFEYYFSHVDSNDRLEKSLKNNANIPSNLHITSGMSAKLDFDDQVSQAKGIFKRICPNEEFLPKPPEQEDIIFDHGDEATEKSKEEERTSIDVSNNQSEGVVASENADIVENQQNNDIKEKVSSTET